MVSSPYISVKNGAPIVPGDAVAQKNIMSTAEHDGRVFAAGKKIGEPDTPEVKYVPFNLPRKRGGAVRFNGAIPPMFPNEFAHARAGERGARSKYKNSPLPRRSRGGAHGGFYTHNRKGIFGAQRLRAIRRDGVAGDDRGARREAGNFFKRARGKAADFRLAPVAVRRVFIVTEIRALRPRIAAEKFPQERKPAHAAVEKNDAIRFHTPPRKHEIGYIYENSGE